MVSPQSALIRLQGVLFLWKNAGDAGAAFEFLIDLLQRAVAPPLPPGELG